MKRDVPLTAVLGLALLIVAAVAYMILIKPKREENAKLDREIAALERKLAATPAAKPTQRKSKVDVSELFRLAKTIPDQEDMPGIILELDSLASSAGVRFMSIKPAEASASSGSPRALPVSVVVDGNYYDVTDFLFRVRNLVSVHEGKLDVDGRLYSLDAIDLHESRRGFPRIEAALTLSAYVSESAASGAAPATPTPTPEAGAETNTGATPSEAPPAASDADAGGGTP